MRERVPSAQMRPCGHARPLPRCSSSCFVVKEREAFRRDGIFRGCGDAGDAAEVCSWNSYRLVGYVERGNPLGDRPDRLGDYTVFGLCGRPARGRESQLRSRKRSSRCRRSSRSSHGDAGLVRVAGNGGGKTNLRFHTRLTVTFSVWPFAVLLLSIGVV